MVNLAQMVGYVSNFGGITKFEQIGEEIEVLTQRVTQIALKMVTMGDFTIVDRLNGQIFPDILGKLLTPQACRLIYLQTETSLIDAYKVLICEAQKAEFPVDLQPNPLLNTRLQFVQTIILKAFWKPTPITISRDMIELLLMDTTLA